MSSDVPVLKLYNTLTREKEEFRPLDRANVRMYVCGPTVYDYAHIGNARPLIVFDVLFRLLRHIYGEAHVAYVRNITDVDDKINARAAERGISIRTLTEETNAVFQADVKALGCLEPTVQPRATEHIAEMIVIIEKLIASGHAYAADGHVLFDVPSMRDYGRLSRRSLDEMIAGARVDVAPYKRGDMDFVLWKPSRGNEPGWESPWGRGRPGWHLECSAMSWKHLGEVFDIHGGGIDLVFPHHENEIAQTRCAFGHDVMANYWLHNGFLQVEGEKMSKSLGNFVTIHELLNNPSFGGHPWPGSVLRLAMLMTHYRHPIDWTVARLNESRTLLSKWGKLIGSAIQNDPLDEAQDWWTAPPSAALLERLCDDLDTPGALSFLSESYSQALSSQSHEKVRQFASDLGFVGLMASETLAFWMPQVGRVLSDVFGEKSIEIQHLIDARLAARAAKNWAESDRIRDELAAMGVALKDNKDGTTSWEVKR